MKKQFIILLFLLAPTLIYGQPRNKNLEDKFEAKKIAWLTTKLDLGADEAKIFWPIYNDYTREQRALKKQRFQKMISFRKSIEIDELNDGEIQALILNDFDFRQRELNLEKKYYNKFKSSLPIKIVGKFYRAQETFKKELLNQFRTGKPQPRN
jgi:hypothetical protein